MEEKLLYANQNKNEIKGVSGINNHPLKKYLIYDSTKLFDDENSDKLFYRIVTKQAVKERKKRVEIVNVI